MTHRILFVASLHHPETLQRELEQAHAENQPLPLFPTSTSLHFLEKALRKQGHTLDIFWRNLSGFGSRDISTLKAEKYTNRITPQRVIQALNNRLPYAVNIDLRQRNANLLNYARQFQPTYIWLIGDNRVIHADTLATLKAELNCKVLYSTGTSPIVFSHPIERDAAPLFDLVIVNDYYHGVQWLELGAQEMICLPISAVDPDFHYPRDTSINPVDVGFVGTLLPENLYGQRVKMLQSLSNFDLGIWSVHDVPPSLQKYVRGSALGHSMIDVLSNTKISVNIHGNFMRYGGNMRLFETAAVGAFQITDNLPGIEEWFTVGEHLVTFETADDLVDKVQYYLAHEDERLAMAQSAREYALKYHTYDVRVQALEAKLRAVGLW